MTLPIVNMNGTSAKDLFDGYWAAMDAVRDASAALGTVEFNARDYYCSPDPEAWSKAKDERQAMFAALEKVRSELQEIALHCMGYLKEGDK